MRYPPSRGDATPLRLLVTVLLLVFLAEMVVTAVLVSLPPYDNSAEEVWSGIALTVLLFPALYLFLVRRLQREVRERREIQASLEARVLERTAELEQARSELELRIQERTAELERVNQDLAKLLEQEQNFRAQLVQTEKFAALGRMVASVAHELNNPLQTIRNCLYLLGQEPGAPDTREFLDLASAEIQRLTELVAQLREVYRPRAASQMLPCDLTRLLEEVRQVMAPHLQRHQVAWEAAPGPAVAPAVINGIAGELKQVFLNLSLNAVEAMQPRGGRIRVSLQPDPDGGRIGVVFRDDGPGIAGEDLSHIFEPLYTTKEEGLGLGLSISYDIVQKHGGRIQVESQPGQGAAFTVWLPVAPDALPETIGGDTLRVP